LSDRGGKLHKLNYGGIAYAQAPAARLGS